MKIVEQDQEIFSIFLNQFGDIDAQGLIVLEYIFELMYKGQYASLPLSGRTEQEGYETSFSNEGRENLPNSD